MLFNGNPLLRYDGYYVLADLLEIPNLAGRANAHAGYLFRRWVLGQKDAHGVTDAAAERRWLAVYAFAAFVYRQFVLLGDPAGGRRLVQGIGSAGGRVVCRLAAGVPGRARTAPACWRPAAAGRAERYLLRATVAAFVVVGLCVMPVRLTTRAEGVMWTPENGEVRAGTDGVLQDWLASPGAEFMPDSHWPNWNDPTIDTRLAAAEADYRAAEARPPGGACDRCRGCRYQAGGAATRRNRLSGGTRGAANAR